MPAKTPAHSRVTPNRDTANVSKENVEFIRAALETWNTGDMDAVREVFDPDVIVRLPEGWPEPGPFVGREEVMRQLLAAWLVVDAQEGGGLPRWSLANIDTGLMVGDPGAAIIAEGVAFGADDFDKNAALHVLVKGATQTNAGAPGTTERPGLALYQSRGYVPLGANASAPTSASLEYYTDDYAIACVAANVGDGPSIGMLTRN